jgi:hypothetical protein
MRTTKTTGTTKNVINRMKHAVLRLVNLSMLPLVVGACGVDASPPGPVSTDSGSAYVPPPGDGAPPPVADALVLPADQGAVQCPDLAGTWKGTIDGKANTYMQNVQMTGVVTMTIAAGATPGEFKLTSLSVEAWSPLLPLLKVPLKTIGVHTFHCNNFNIAAPIEAQGKKGSGTITGQCTATQCTGTFQGKTDDETMDASGNFKISKE